MKHIVFYYDKFFQIFTYDENLSHINTHLVDLPKNIIVDGLIKDSQHLKYLFLKYFKDNKYNKDDLFFVINSNQQVTKAYDSNKSGIQSIDEMEREAEKSLKDLKFSHKKFEKYFYSIGEGKSIYRYAYTFIPKEIIESFTSFLDGTSFKEVKIIPSHILILDYMNLNKCKEIWSLDDLNLSFFKFDDNKIYFKEQRAEALEKLYMSRNFMYSEIPSLISGKYDTRVSRESYVNFEDDFYEALTIDINYLDKLSQQFKTNNKIYLYESYFKNLELDLWAPIRGQNNFINTIGNFDLSKHLLDNFNNQDSKYVYRIRNKWNPIYIFLLLGILVMVISFLLGQNISEKNQKLEKDSHQLSILSDRNLNNDNSDLTIKANSEANANKISEMLNLINGSKPENIQITRITYDNELYEVNGQLTNKDDLAVWIKKLSESKLTIEEEPTTSIDGMEYFKIMIKEGKEND